MFFQPCELLALAVYDSIKPDHRLTCTLFRYIVIVHPMKAKWLCTRRSTYKMIAAVWAASLLLSSPTLHIMVYDSFYLLTVAVDAKNSTPGAYLEGAKPAPPPKRCNLANA